MIEELWRKKSRKRCKTPKEVNGLQVFRDKHSRPYIMQPCKGCGLIREVRLKLGIPESYRCRKCSAQRTWEFLVGEKNPFWKGGRTKHTQGYIMVAIHPDDFFTSMAFKRGAKGRERLYIFEHRLVMAKSLGRNLHSWELVHHKNGIKDDNRLENLQLVTDERHKQITILENRIKTLEKRVTLLEAENLLLKQHQEAI